MVTTPNKKVFRITPISIVPSTEAMFKETAADMTTSREQIRVQVLSRDGHNR